MLLDLTGDLYTFGRGETCDYQFSTDSALMKQCYQAYSKVHFKVTKVMCFVCSFSPTKRQWRETSIDGALLHFFLHAGWLEKLWTGLDQMFNISSLSVWDWLDLGYFHPGSGPRGSYFGLPHIQPYSLARATKIGTRLVIHLGVRFF